MIKNIIFDFGDIFINLDKKATLNAFKKLGISSINTELSLVLHQYEKGQISTDNFIAYFSENYQLKQQDIVKAWNAILLDFPIKRLEFLKELKELNKYKLFLLSNTNELHISWIKNNWGLELYEDFKNCFEQFYLSHKIHLRKPDVAIFNYVLSENNLNAHETFFIDDVVENTTAAQQIGINTWNLIPGLEDVTQLFTKI